MDYDQNQLDEYVQDAKLPTFLNVLTILTFIGSGFGVLGAFFLPFTCKMLDKLADNPAMTESQMEATAKMCENVNFMIISAIIGAGLCIFGALQMRKRKKMGFFIYLAGTFLPLILSIIMNGMSSVTADTKTMVITVIGSLLFPILYATQLKELTK
jgi:hypothetical protein